jgi:hypothetical protein
MHGLFSHKIPDLWSLKFSPRISFLNARPSHIQADNHSIPVPDIVSVGTGSPSNSPGTASSPQSYIFLCRLSAICSRLQSQVCTLASSILLPAERLEKVKAIEEETHILLSEVRRDETGRALSSGVGTSFSTSPVKKPNSEYCQASFLTCLLGFRCMLRRISIELSIGLGSP